MELRKIQILLTNGLQPIGHCDMKTENASSTRPQFRCTACFGCLRSF